MIAITKIVTPTNLQIFNLFVKNPGHIANITDICKELSLAPQTVHAHMDNLVETNVIKKHIVSKTVVYILNQESAQTKALIQILEIYESAFKDVEG